MLRDNRLPCHKRGRRPAVQNRIYVVQGKHVLGAARNGAISGALRRNQRSQGGAAARLFESMGEDAVQHSTASFYIFSLPGDSGLRYDPILRQLLMLP